MSASEHYIIHLISLHAKIFLIYVHVFDPHREEENCTDVPFNMELKDPD